MAKIVTTKVLEADTSRELETKINQTVSSIQSRGNDARIQYVQPVISPRSIREIWSALVTEREGSPIK